MAENRFRALTVVAFPAMLTIGILTIPFVSDYSDHILAEQAASHTARWFWGHVFSAGAFGVATLAACSTAGLLSQRTGTQNVGLPFVAVGAALYAAGLGADGIGPVAVAAAGGQARVFFDGSSTWIGGLFVAASMTFALGLVVQLIGVIRAGVLTGAVRVLVLFAAIIFAGAGAIPSGWGLYLIAAAAWAVYIPKGIAIWRAPGAENSHG